MSMGIESFKKKPNTNLALHDNFLLLVYEFLKTQMRGKSLGHSRDDSKATGSSKYSNSKEVQSLSSKDEDNTSSKGKKPKGGEKISPPVSIIFNRKSPQTLTPKLVKQEEEEYNEEEEEIELEEEKKGEEITILSRNPKKRKDKEELQLEERKDLTPEASRPFPSISPSQEIKEIMVKDSEEIIMKDRRRSSRNLNTKLKIG